MFEERKTIKLTRSYTVHGTTFDTVVLRSPKLKDLLFIGSPAELQMSGGKNTVLIEFPERIEQYLERIAESPTADMLTDILLPDALLVKEAVLDFFTQARKTSSPPPTSSSSRAGEA
mgnify:CR=1 FL=1